MNEYTRQLLDLSGRVALVTGAAKGIGEGIAEHLAGAGASVILADIDEETAIEAARQLQARGLQAVACACDMANPESIEACVAFGAAQFGALDILVNNAGRGDDCPVDKVTEEYWEKMLALNLKGVFFASQACLPALKASSGNIVNIASGLGVVGGPPGSAVYSVTKTALIQMGRMMALQFATEGVRVNNVVPGWIDTPMIRRENELLGDNVLFDYIATTTPMARIGTAEECAGAVLYLAAPMASFTTGATLCADGGLTAGRYL